MDDCAVHTTHFDASKKVTVPRHNETPYSFYDHRGASLHGIRYHSDSFEVILITHPLRAYSCGQVA
jgi:hypothetical protein